MRKGDSEIVANATHKGICTDEKEDSEIVANVTRKAICIDKKGDSEVVVNATRWRKIWGQTMDARTRRVCPPDTRSVRNGDVEGLAAEVRVGVSAHACLS